MACETYGELISAMVDDALSADERQALSVHLAACPRCAAEYEDLSALKRALGGLAAREAPPRGFWRGVLRRLDAADAAELGQAGRPAAVRPSLAYALAAALVVAAVAGVLYTRSAPRPLSLPAMAADFAAHEAPPGVPYHPGGLRDVVTGLGYPVQVPRFPEPRTQLLTARRCDYHGVTFAQMTFDTPLGPIGFYQLPASDVRLPPALPPPAGQRPLRFTARGSHNVVAWTEGDMAYAIVSEADPVPLADLARKLSFVTAASALAEGASR